MKFFTEELTRLPQSVAWCRRSYRRRKQRQKNKPFNTEKIEYWSVTFYF